MSDAVSPSTAPARRATILASVGACVLTAAAPAIAAEGGASHCPPRATAGIFLALPPEPGLQVANVFWFQSGHTGSAVLEGQVSLDLDLDLILNITSLTYTFDQPVLGGRYTIGAAIPFGNASLDGSPTGPRGRQFGFSDESFALSDIAFTPI